MTSAGALAIPLSTISLEIRQDCRRQRRRRLASAKSDVERIALDKKATLRCGSGILSGAIRGNAASSDSRTLSSYRRRLTLCRLFMPLYNLHPREHQTFESARVCACLAERIRRLGMHFPCAKL